MMDEMDTSYQSSLPDIRSGARIVVRRMPFSSMNEAAVTDDQFECEAAMDFPVKAFRTLLFGALSEDLQHALEVVQAYALVRVQQVPVEEMLLPTSLEIAQAMSEGARLTFWRTVLDTHERPAKTQSRPGKARFVIPWWLALALCQVQLAEMEAFHARSLPECAPD